MMREIFSEDNGQLSSMRIMSFLAIFMTMFITIFSLVKCTVRENFQTLILWACIATVPKTVQKFAERKLEQNVEEINKGE